jgi:hypothetical protein
MRLEVQQATIEILERRIERTLDWEMWCTWGGMRHCRFFVSDWVLGDLRVYLDRVIAGLTLPPPLLQRIEEVIRAPHHSES